jgi:hypothetical protein
VLIRGIKTHERIRKVDSPPNLRTLHVPEADYRQAFKAYEFLRNDLWRAAYDAELLARRHHFLLMQVARRQEREAAAEEANRRTLGTNQRGQTMAERSEPDRNLSIHAEQSQSESRLTAEENLEWFKVGEEAAYAREYAFLRQECQTGRLDVFQDAEEDYRREAEWLAMGPETHGRERARAKFRLQQGQVMDWGMQHCPL